MIEKPLHQPVEKPSLYRQCKNSLSSEQHQVPNTISTTQSKANQYQTEASLSCSRDSKSQEPVINTQFPKPLNFYQTTSSSRLNRMKYIVQTNKQLLKQFVTLESVIKPYCNKAKCLVNLICYQV